MGLKISSKPKGPLSGDSGKSLAERAREALEKAAAARERRAIKAKAHGWTAKAARDVWAREVSSVFPKYVPVVSLQDAAILKTYLTKAAHAGIGAAEFLRWSVENWRRVVQREFAWAKNPPELPAIRFFVRFADKFHAAYCSRTVRGELAEASYEERIEASVVKARVRREKPAGGQLGGNAWVLVAGSQTNKEQGERLARMRRKVRHRPNENLRVDGKGTFGAWEG